MMTKYYCLIVFLFSTLSIHATSPITGLLERIDKGASQKFVIEQKKSDTDFFELDQKGNKVVIRGNNYVSIATGINWYLKYYAGIHLSWNGMTADLPSQLPPVLKKERHETTLPYRYDLNYCTYSYTMAFWDWERWEKEIDWMALHGINLPLAITGTDVVWYQVLNRLGYSKEEINSFIAGPAFQAWWLMNNLEGWGGPNPDSWYEQQADLQKKIVKRMREYGIEPVLPGYSGMVPHDAKEKLQLNVQNPGLWCAYNRPDASTQQGTHESVFCARPSLQAYQVSSWSEMSDYYDPEDVIEAARLMVSVADQFIGNNNFEYDLIDIVRQAIAEKGRLLLKSIRSAYHLGDQLLYRHLSDQFLDLILLQDELLSTRSEFKVGSWIAQARNKGITEAEKDLYEWNARVQITTWGNRTASEKGGLRDYAHREWSGLLKDVYYIRWKTFFDQGPDSQVDYYAMDEKWTKQTNPYSVSSSDDCIESAQKIFRIVFDSHITK